MTSPSKIVFKAPFNSLSFGQVSYNLAKAMFESNMDVSIIPYGNNVEFTAFNNISKDFLDWFTASIKNRYSGITNDSKCLQLWHLRESDNKPTKHSTLFTFHEILGVTPTEKAICGLHDKVIFSSTFSKNNFQQSGVTNVANVTLGFDTDIVGQGSSFEDVIHFGIIGKFEARKNTEKIIKTWLKLYGNNKKYLLTCLIDNPFFDRGLMASIYKQLTDNGKYFNITFLNRLQTNAEVNSLYNSIDVDLSGLSSAEGWNLPAFNATCLGKWSCVLNHTSHMDWANESNCILLQPDGTREPYDNTFFKKGDEYNQGLIYKVDDSTIENGILLAEKAAKTPNPNGIMLREKFTYKNTLNSLLELM